MHPVSTVATVIRQRLAAGEHPLAILRWLEADHGFIWRHDRDPQLLRGHGVSTSCTAGPHGLLTNWCASADRKYNENSN